MNSPISNQNLKAKKNRNKGNKNLKDKDFNSSSSSNEESRYNNKPVEKSLIRSESNGSTF